MSLWTRQLTRLCLLVCIAAGVLACSSTANDAQSDGPRLQNDAGKDGAKGGPDGARSGDLGVYSADLIVVPKAKLGEACQQASDCAEGSCQNKVCFKACQRGKDCPSGFDCASEDGTTLFCRKATYSSEVGAFCGITGTCPSAATKCFGSIGAATAYCTAQCKTDLDCPSQYYCREMSDKTKYCTQRDFCDRCLHDDNCPENHVCVKQGTTSFCAKICAKDSHECPGYATCSDSGDGQRFVCKHKAGQCVGRSQLCDPCIDKQDCPTDGLCLTFVSTQESFCSKSCAANPCGDDTKYECTDIQGNKQCVPRSGPALSPVPDGEPSEPMPTCVNEISRVMDVGDVMDDFAMVGYRDVNQDGSLVGEKPQVIKLSDYAKTHKLILFNVSAGWCGPCQQETRSFKYLIDSFGKQGFVIFQVLFDTDEKGVKPTLAFLDQWVKILNAQEAAGIDPARGCLVYNHAGSTPLNMLVDAKTRKVLYKGNGVPPGLDLMIRDKLGLSSAPSAPPAP